MKVRLTIAVIGFVLVAIGAFLWVDAGTGHMDSTTQSWSVLTSGGPQDDGPNRRR